MWCDPNLSYHDTWTQMTGLFERLQHKRAFCWVLLIPASAPYAMSIMEAWSDSMPSTLTLLCTVPALHHPCCVGTSVYLSEPTDVHIHLVHNALAEMQHPGYTHTIVSTLGEKIKRISGAFFEQNFFALLFSYEWLPNPGRVVAHLVWGV